MELQQRYNKFCIGPSVLILQMCKKYQKPEGDASKWTYAEQLAYSFHAPNIFLPKDVAAKFISQVQINLLPRAQVCSSSR